MQDFSANWHIVKVVCSLKTASTTEAEEEVITTITSEGRIACLVSCALRFVISFCLLWQGFIWLSSTTSYSDLILNAVALAFILDVDGVLYTFALPANMRDSLAAKPVADLSDESKVRAKLEKGDTTGALELAQEVATGSTSLKYRAGWLIATFSTVNFYVFNNGMDGMPYLTVLPGYKHDVQGHCDGVRARPDTLTCISNEYGECFPYGR